MPKGGWEMDLRWLDSLEETVRVEAQNLCDAAAMDVLERAKKLVPQPGKSQGYATGALKASGYVKNGNGFSGYAAAVAAASAAPGTVILERNQIEPEFWIDISDKDSFMSVVHFPLEYADLVRFGYYHVLAEKQIPGNDFLQDALQPVEAKFQRDAQNMITRIMRNYSNRRKPITPARFLLLFK